MNDWTISEANFIKHCDWIRTHADPVSLDAIRDSQIAASRSTPMVAVTFDDGYHENCQHAIPHLLERNIPVTYFVSTHFVQSGEPFPHDAKRNQCLRPNSIADIQQMARLGVQIGAHSHTHVDFGKPMSTAHLRAEIFDVRKRLQDWTGQSIEYFAFPYGLKNNISQEAIDCVFESGYRCFVSAAGGLNLPGQDADHLQRIHGDPGMGAFKNWLTFDPRKTQLPSPISYSKPQILNRAVESSKHELTCTGR
jgi:peptidoglycan/xylan/chitin deacetylase (PgdA/CDA1 family)